MLRLCWFKTEYLVPGLFLALILFSSALAGPHPGWDTEERLGKPLFELYNIVRITSAPNSQNLEIRAEVVHDVLTFVREKDGFRAEIEIILSVLVKDSALVQRYVKRQSKNVDTFDKTNSSTAKITESFNIDLPAGDYVLIAAITDRESKRTSTTRKEITIQPWDADRFTISELLLTESRSLDNETGRPQNPVYNRNVEGNSSEVYCFFDLYRPEPAKITKLRYEIIRGSKTVLTDSSSILGGVKFTPHFARIRLDSLKFGAHLLRMRVEYNGSDITREIMFRLNSQELPRYITELNEAIEQMTYLVNDDEIKRLMKLPEDQKKDEFLGLWNHLFPTSDKRMNRKMIEYYKRVKYTNQRFGRDNSGWRSDRGRVYIVYGAPTSVERQSFEDNQPPYEIWYYRNLNRRFIFRDDLGFGDYRLVNSAW